MEETQDTISKESCIALKIVVVLAKCADLDEMPLSAAFHLGLHCLSKYLNTSFFNALRPSKKNSVTPGQFLVLNQY